MRANRRASLYSSRVSRRMGVGNRNLSVVRVRHRREKSPQELEARSRMRSYDAAATTRHTENHFLYADGRDANTLIRASLMTLRNRARYEIRNNTYAKGIVDTKANDMIGTGPRLQVVSDDNDFNRQVEDRFARWCQSCDLRGEMGFNEILRLAGSLQQDESGEALVLLQNIEPELSWVRAKRDVSLRLLCVEPDRLPVDYTTSGVIPSPIGAGDKVRDGIERNRYGRPLRYYILKQHPGSDRIGYAGLVVGDYDIIDAEHVIHLYRLDRPGQSRGVPWITPAIPLFAQMRRWTLATLSAAETAANVSGTLETEATGELDEDEVDVGDEVEIARNALLTLPLGTKMNQLKPEQPSSTYRDFKHELLNEIARCLNMPFNVAAANSSGYNYASGRLDWQVYYRMIKTVRGWLEGHICNRVFYAWLREALLIPGYIRARMPDELSTQWFWPGAEHVDPDKEAKAQEKRIKSQTTTLAAEYAIQGKDWEREIRQLAKEEALLKELGLQRTENKPPKPKMSRKKSQSSEDNNAKEK